MTLFQAAALVAFFGALLISKLVAMGKRDTSLKALQQEDLIVQDGQLKINIRRSKADPLGKGRQLILGQCSIKHICPIQAVQEFMEIRGPNAGYFFQYRGVTTYKISILETY